MSIRVRVECLIQVVSFAFGDNCQRKPGEDSRLFYYPQLSSAVNKNSFAFDSAHSSDLPDFFI